MVSVVVVVVGGVVVGADEVDEKVVTAAAESVVFDIFGTLQWRLSDLQLKE